MQAKTCDECGSEDVAYWSENEDGKIVMAACSNHGKEVGFVKTKTAPPTKY